MKIIWIMSKMSIFPAIKLLSSSPLSWMRVSRLTWKATSLQNQTKSPVVILFSCKEKKKGAKYSP